jgi:hypothetical protein
MVRLKLLVICLSFAPLVAAQTKVPPQYRIEIRVRESSREAAAKESRYTLLVQSESKGALNASYRVPFYSSTKGEAKELHTVALGNIFECSAHGAEGGVRLDCAFESSFISKRQTSPPPVGFPPLIQSRTAHTTAVLPLGKELPMAAMDDPTTGNRLEFFVSAQQNP